MNSQHKSHAKSLQGYEQIVQIKTESYIRTSGTLNSTGGSFLYINDGVISSVSLFPQNHRDRP